VELGLHVHCTLSAARACSGAKEEFSLMHYHAY